MKIKTIELSKRSVVATEDGYELISEKPKVYPLVLTNAALQKSQTEGLLTQDLKGVFIHLNKAKKEIEKLGEEMPPEEILGFFKDDFVLGLIYTAYRGGAVLSGELPMSVDEFLNRYDKPQGETLKIFMELASDFLNPKN